MTFMKVFFKGFKLHISQGGFGSNLCSSINCNRARVKRVKRDGKKTKCLGIPPRPFKTPEAQLRPCLGAFWPTSKQAPALQGGGCLPARHSRALVTPAPARLVKFNSIGGAQFQKGNPIGVGWEGQPPSKGFCSTGVKRAAGSLRGVLAPPRARFR